MTFATYPYKDKIREIFASIEEHRRVNTIALYQGEHVNPNFYYTWLLQTSLTSEEIKGLIDELCANEALKKLVLDRHKRKWHNEVSWEYYIENSVNSLLVAIPEDYRCWQCVMLEFIYSLYRNETKQKYPAYYANNPLERYYRSKGIELNMLSNYGLIDTADFEIKYLNGSKLYDKRFDTHLFVKFITPELLQFLAEIRQKAPFKLSLRPDYEICGDGIRDMAPILEALIRGSKEPLEIDMMPSLTWLCDDATSSDRLIIRHKKKECDITFEELVGAPEIEDDYIVSQVVHLRYIKENGNIYIHHIDHEYVFYTSDQHTEKMEDLTIKGEARTRYKTFKIDDAKIPYGQVCSKNIVYQTLDAYFENKALLKEYFESMIDK